MLARLETGRLEIVDVETGESEDEGRGVKADWGEVGGDEIGRGEGEGDLGEFG